MATGGEEVPELDLGLWGVGGGGRTLSSQQRFHGSISCMYSCEHVITFYPAERAKMRPDVPMGQTGTRMVFQQLVPPTVQSGALWNLLFLASNPDLQSGSSSCRKLKPRPARESGLLEGGLGSKAKVPEKGVLF